MDPVIIAGPCAAESKEQLFTTASQLRQQFSESEIKLSFFRVGVWKARSNPNAFKGLGEIALPWLKEISEEFDLPVCVEIAKPEHVDLCLKYGINSVWIGSRTVVNPFDVQELADALSGTDMTVMVKNPIVPDLNLWAGGIERVMKAGISKIYAIHRGFAEMKENVLRNKPLWEIPIELKVKYPEIPIICDPSHIAGNTQYIPTIAQIALDYGFNGLMIETHCCPNQALSDAEQQITPAQLYNMLHSLIFKYRNDSPDEELLRKQRNLIHDIDSQIAELLVKRMLVVDEIAVIKTLYNIPIIQSNQWNNVVKRYQKNSLPDEHYASFIEKFLELLHQQSILRQQKIKEI